jgi:hypothetical protein
MAETHLGQSVVDRPYTPQEKAALVRRNARALSLLRQGFSHRYGPEPPKPTMITRRGSPGIIGWFSGGTHCDVDKLARLLVLEGQVRLAQGKLDGAGYSFADAVRLGGSVAQGSTEFGADPIDFYGRRELWKMVDRLPAPDARAIAHRLAAIMARYPPFACTLERERREGEALIMAFFREPDWRRNCTRTPPFWTTPQPTRLQSAIAKVKPHVCSKHGVMRSFEQYMNKYVANARLPYAAPATWPDPPSDPVFWTIHPGPIDAFFVEKDHFAYASNQAQNVLLLVALALRAYRTERGAYPVVLADLVPGYLSTIPSDPFALRRSVRYRRVGRSYVAYSVGPDGIDNGGQAIVSPTRASTKDTGSSKWRYRVDKNSKGDIVAGVNTRTGY